MFWKEKTISSPYCNVNINAPCDCNTSNVIYLIKCLKCDEQYVGQTGRKFLERIKEHVNYVRSKKLNQPTGFHFNLPGHNLSNLQATIIEKCSVKSTMFRETREEFFIKRFKTKYNGMNKKL